MEHGENLSKESTLKENLKIIFFTLVIMGIGLSVTFAIALFALLCVSYEGFEGLNILVHMRSW